MKTIPYCPISREQFLTMVELLEPDQVGRVLTSVCDAFFNDSEYLVESRQESVFCEKMLDFADDKYEKWYSKHKNFIESNPKKSQ
jgi:hypothetical protein